MKNRFLLNNYFRIVIATMAMLLMPVVAMAVDYDIVITTGTGDDYAQKIISSYNAKDVLNDGTLSYDATNNELILNNIDLTCSGEFSAAFIDCTLREEDHSITVRLVGSNHLQLVENARFFYGSDITFTTNEDNPGSLTIETESYWDNLFYTSLLNGVQITPSFQNHLYSAQSYYPEGYEVKQVPVPFIFSQHNDDAVSIGFEYDMDSGEEVHYSIDYVDDEQADVIDEVYDNDFVTLNGPCTVTAYTAIGTLQSTTKTAKLFGLTSTSVSTTFHEPVAPPTIVPDIPEGASFSIIQDPDDASENYLISPTYNPETGLIEYSTVGTALCIAKLEMTDDETTILNEYNNENDYYNLGTFTLTVSPKELTDAMVDDIPDMPYTGSEICPTITVRDGNRILTEYEDYYVNDDDYSNNTEVGEATVTVHGTGNYTGTVTKHFNIVQTLGITIHKDAHEVYVTDKNCADVLGDGTISYDQENNILTLNNAEFGKDWCAMTCSLPSLTIHLLGNSVAYASECFFRMEYFNEKTKEFASLTITTDDSNPGTLTFINTEGFTIDENDIFQDVNTNFNNGLALTQKGKKFIVAVCETYNMWVGGVQLSSINKDNVFDDDNKTVRFDEATNTLTLRNANIEADGDTLPIICEIGNLTVNLIGSNTIFSNVSPIFFAPNPNGDATPTLTFITSVSDPGKLVFTGKELSIFFNVVYENGLALYENAIACNQINYGFTVAGTQVTSINADNVLCDEEKTVSYDPATTTLTLKNVNWNDKSIILPSTCDISTLTVQLAGTNTINNASTPVFISENGASLVFTINVNSPGSLLMIEKDNSTFQNGFTFTSDTENDTYLQNGLKQGADVVGNGWKIATFVPVDPIVNEETPEITLIISDDESEYENLINNNINNVYYNLPDTGENGPLQGYDNGDGDGIPGIIIGMPMSDEDVEIACNNPIGSDAFKDAFTGISVMTPRGIGEFSFYAKALGEDGVLRVKVGNEPPYTPDVNSLDYILVTVRYNCIEPTPILIYLQQETTSRSNGPRREKVKSTSVKITRYNGSSMAIFSNNTATVYAMPSGSYNIANHTVSLTSINPSSYDYYAPSRRNAPSYGEEQNYPIVKLGPGVFDEISNKDEINYIDLTGTQIKDMVVNREGGAMNGISNHTFILLPEDNDDGYEPNVVIGDNCNDMILDDDYTFLIPAKDFTAAKATLNRTFTANQTSTVFLPFTIPAAQAENMGHFHTFKEIQGSKAIFNEAETGDIPANTPFIFMPTATKLEANNVIVNGLDATSAISGDLVGTYEKISWDSDQTSIYSFAAADDDTGIVAGEFVRVAAGSFIKPFRAFLRTTNSNTRLQVAIDNIATGITNVESITDSNKWYTIDGLTLDKQPQQKGIYLHNGKKIIVK